MKKILSELEENAKQSDRGIAKKLGCSQVSVTRYRKRLEKKNIIWGYSAIVNPLKDRNIYFCLWKINPKNPNPMESIKNS